MSAVPDALRGHILLAAAQAAAATGDNTQLFQELRGLLGPEAAPVMEEILSGGNPINIVSKHLLPKLGGGGKREETVLYCRCPGCGFAFRQSI